MAQNQNIPRRLWKIETTHRGVATHSLRTTGLHAYRVCFPYLHLPRLYNIFPVWFEVFEVA